MAGVTIVLPPQTTQGVRPLHSSTTWQASGLSASFWERAGGGTEEKILFLLPSFARPGEEEDMDVVQNGIVSSFYFIFVNSAWNVVAFPKTRRFI